MGLKDLALRKGNPIYGFANQLISMMSSITLLVTLGDGEHIVTEMVEFLANDYPIAYNVIFKRPIMRMA